MDFTCRCVFTASVKETSVCCTLSVYRPLAAFTDNRVLLSYSTKVTMCFWRVLVPTPNVWILKSRPAGSITVRPSHQSMAEHAMRCVCVCVCIVCTLWCYTSCKLLNLFSSRCAIPWCMTVNIAAAFLCECISCNITCIFIILNSALPRLSKGTGNI